jgi:hypothetical protein
VSCARVTRCTDLTCSKRTSSWKPIFDEGDGTALLDLFWNLFNNRCAATLTRLLMCVCVCSRGECRGLAMEIVVELSSVRRSLFEEDEQRGGHLARIMNGITDGTRCCWMHLRTRQRDDSCCVFSVVGVAARSRGAERREDAASLLSTARASQRQLPTHAGARVFACVSWCTMVMTTAR